MSSVAVLTPESFAEHRSGLKDQEITGNTHLLSVYTRSIPSCFRLLCLFIVIAVGQAVSRRMRLTSRPTSRPSLRCQRRGHRGRRPGSQHQRGEARSGQSKRLSSPRWGKTQTRLYTQVQMPKERNYQQNPHFKRQVFHVPLEERRYKDNSQFGEGEEAKVCLDIMQRTGAHIELSLAKDQGLSIMVTGKLDSVMKARKEIVARLQTQVRDRACSLLNKCVKTLLCFCLKILITSAGISRGPIIHSDIIVIFECSTIIYCVYFSSYWCPSPQHYNPLTVRDNVFVRCIWIVLVIPVFVSFTA